VIPLVPEIQDSLLALSLVEVPLASPDDRCIVVCEPTRRAERSQSGEWFFEDTTALVLRQSPSAPLTLPRLLNRISEELYKEGHSHVSPKADRQLALAGKVLGMATAFGGSKLASIEIVNHILSLISLARVSQWAVLINPGASPEHYRFGDFIYGNIELEKLEYRSEKAGSDFARRYGQSLQSRRSILREGRELRLIDVNAIKTTTSPGASGRDLMYRIFDDYYANVASIEREVFMLDLDRQQAVFGAAGLGTIPSETLRMMEAMTQWITIFERRERGHGWVVPDQTVMQVSSTEPKALADGYLAIKNALKLGDWNERPLDASIQAFSQYLTAAQDHERSDRIEEGLLHIVFALDLLLGGSSGEALTAVLAERTAIVSHLAVGRPIEEAVEFVRECYDMRSAYVHRGEKGRLVGLNERFEKLFRIARAVLGAACFARLQPWCQNKDARDTWVKRIDILKARYTAGLPFAQTELEELGLERIHLRTGELVSVSIEPRTEKTQ
jgi:hypothetical protein